MRQSTTFTMKSLGLGALASAIVTIGACLPLADSRADDIDIYLGYSGSTLDAPNIIFLIDNGPNWSRQSQAWCTSVTQIGCSGSGKGLTQGQAEVQAISIALQKFATTPMNVGLAMLTAYGGSAATGAPGTGGGYLRFGVRDMTVLTNRVALTNILVGPDQMSGLFGSTTNSTEKLSGMAQKDESEAFYEIYKYLSGLAPYSGPYGSSYAKQNGLVDVAGNLGSLSDPTAAGQGLTSGFALANGLYQTPLSANKPCQGTYIVYIANNANQTGSSGQGYYQRTVADADPALPSSVTALDTWLDEWTRFLLTTGVITPPGNTNGSVTTYILDAYNGQQNVPYSNSLKAAAKSGGGQYYAVQSAADVLNARSSIITQIQAVNSTFASASLPINATNRAQDQNEVFIPMFRPDPKAYPRWMGNLKRYQLILSSTGGTALGDYSATPIDVVNPLTGFPVPCAVSFDTSDSGSYWYTVPETPSPAGTCTTVSNNAYSDYPDGPTVEKGGTAEVIRKGNNPPSTNTTPTWTVNRTIWTSSLTNNTLFNFNNPTKTGLMQTLIDYTYGHDVNDENGNLNVTETRPSLHGDTVHSRPLPLNFSGGTTGYGVVTFYGSNDGTLRAVNADTGQELWAYVAPEFYNTSAGVDASRLARLYNNSPQILYPGMNTTFITPTPLAKNYFFDGSMGFYQNPGSGAAWIFPTMRRGGRMIYAFDVSNPGSPSIKWKAGCPDLADNTGCTTGLNNIGQTWSTPAVAAQIQGYSNPVIVVGGGYDSCEDQNTSVPSCGNTTGNRVYVLDATNGTLLKTFFTTRAVAADVALLAVNNAAIVDHAYAVDTGGNIYRIDFGTSGPTGWVMNRVAYTNGAGRKFLFSPALLLAPGGLVYVALGSGDREHPLISEYPYPTATNAGVTNRFYVYLDNLSSTTEVNLDGDSSNNALNFTTATSCSTAGLLPTAGGQARSWYMDLTQYGAGEQTVTSAVIVSGEVAFSTNRPIPVAQGTCASQLGAAEGYFVNLFNGSGGIGVAGAACGGSRASSLVGGGLPPSPVIATVNVGGQTQTVVIGAAQLDGSTSSAIGAQQVSPAIVPKRKLMYWKSSGEN